MTRGLDLRAQIFGAQFSELNFWVKCRMSFVQGRAFCCRSKQPLQFETNLILPITKGRDTAPIELSRHCSTQLLNLLKNCGIKQLPVCSKRREVFETRYRNPN